VHQVGSIYKTLSLCSFLSVRSQVPHPHKARDVTVAVYSCSSQLSACSQKPAVVTPVGWIWQSYLPLSSAQLSFCVFLTSRINSWVECPVLFSPPSDKYNSKLNRTSLVRLMRYPVHWAYYSALDSLMYC